MSRCIFRIELTESAKAKLHIAVDRLGLTQVAVTSKLVEWFSTQDDAIQKAVLGLFPKTYENEVAVMILKRIAQQ